MVETKKNENVGSLMNEIKENLENVILESQKNRATMDYAAICSCALQLLDEIFGKDQYSMPIDVEQIYQELEIPIIEMDLNSYMEDCDPKRVNVITGKISIRRSLLNDKIVRKNIYIDENTAPIQQRYAMAHELCHYILKMDERMFSDEYCNMPMLPKDPAELVADAFAIFLLIPLGPFLEEFLAYVERERRSGRPPFKTSDWFEHLSAVSYVEEDYVAYGYQEIRFVANWLYEMKLRDEEEAPSKEVEVLWSKKDKYITDDIIRGLFI